MAWNSRTKEEIEKVINDLGYDLLNEYIYKEKRKVVIQDKIGYKYDVYLSHLTNPKLGLNIVDKSNPYSIKNIPIWLNINNSDFILCDNNTYISSRTKLKFYHRICDDFPEISWSDVQAGYGCGICHGLQVGKKTSLEYLRPDLAMEWHSVNELRPNKVTCGSHKKVFWICSICNYGKNGEWKSTVSHRTNGRGCPACAEKVVSDINRLSKKFTIISSEWDYDKNKDSPDDVSYGSNKKRWWICPKGHSYFSSINSRTIGENGCDKCNLSKGEDAIASWLDKNISNIRKIGISKYSHPKRFLECKDKKPLPFDFALEFIGGEMILVEYHGIQHYQPIRFSYSISEEESIDNFKTQQNRDKIKEKYCKDNNIPLLVIPYWEFNNVESLLEQTLFE